MNKQLISYITISFIRMTCVLQIIANSERSWTSGLWDIPPAGPDPLWNFPKGAMDFIYFFAMGVHCLFFENLRSVDLPDALTFTRLLRSDLAYFCYNFMYRLQNVFMKLKRAKLIRLEETVTIQSTCFVKDVQLIAWYLFTQNKSWVFF